MDRETQIAGFLERHGWGVANRGLLAGDASFRRYDRLNRNGEAAVLMDAPPPHEDIRPFVHVARYLKELGLAAPQVLAEDDAAGLLLLEDLGDDLFSRVLREGGAGEDELYAAAIDVLVALHGAGARVELPAYDDGIMTEMALLLVDWFAPLAGIDLPSSARDDFAGVWRVILPQAHIGPDVVILRDYHADNLIWLPERRGLERVGLLDFQDAMIGPRAYDLVSLLEDARRDVAPATVSLALERYLAAFPELDADAFQTAYSIAGAQRNCRIIGVFCRLLTRDGKPGYQDLLPRVWGHLAHDLEHSATAPLKDWLDRWVPPKKRTRAA